jgi:hypothetical protein
VLAVAAAYAAGPPKRARPPKFPKSIADVFFPDALKTLTGPRPQRATIAADGDVPETPEPETAPDAASGEKWSRLITAEAVEDEIKSAARDLAASVSNAGAFKSGGYQQARVALGVLAALFAIDAEHDERLRWQREAAGMRDRAARAGFNCKVATDAAYRDAKSVSDDVEGLIRGGSVQLPAASREADWPKVTDRAPLMKRLEQAQQQTLGPASSNDKAFKAQPDKLAHEAQLVAAVAEVIQADGYEFAEDDSYRELARAMQVQAIAVRNAASKGDYNAARQAVGALGKTCTDCHEGYRN